MVYIHCGFDLSFSPCPLSSCLQVTDLSRAPPIPAVLSLRFSASCMTVSTLMTVTTLPTLGVSVASVACPSLHAVCSRHVPLGPLWLSCSDLG